MKDNLAIYYGLLSNPSNTFDFNIMSPLQEKWWCSFVGFLGFFGQISAKGNFQKRYQLIFAIITTKTVHIDSCLDFKAYIFVHVFRQVYTNRRYQPVLLEIDNKKSVVHKVRQRSEKRKISNDILSKKIKQWSSAE